MKITRFGKEVGIDILVFPNLVEMLKTQSEHHTLKLHYKDKIIYYGLTLVPETIFIYFCEDKDYNGFLYNSDGDKILTSREPKGENFVAVANVKEHQLMEKVLDEYYKEKEETKIEQKSRN